EEILALAITNEEEDSRIYRGFAEGLREAYPASAKLFEEMAEEEVRHRSMLFDLYRQKFGEYLPLIRRQDVRGFINQRRPLWLMRPLGIEEVRKYAAEIATHDTWQTFLVGMAASVGAGISMGFAEALSDDGSLTGRGAPLIRGVVCGVMTALGGLGHTLPYLIPHFWTATGVSIVVVI